MDLEGEGLGCGGQQKLLVTVWHVFQYGYKLWCRFETGMLMFGWKLDSGAKLVGRRRTSHITLNFALLLHLPIIANFSHGRSRAGGGSVIAVVFLNVASEG